MTNCKYITKNGRCGLKGSYAYRHGCFGEDMCRCREPMTNAQKIRAMSDEELAAIIMCPIQFDEKAECIEGNCFQCSLKWLKQPSGEEDKHETD